MTTPVDLDLVELRCRIRGWRCERGYRCVRVYKSGTRRFTAIADTGQVGPNRWEEERSCEAFDGDEEVVDILTAPRWTLERLLSEPPEGWRVVPPADPGTAVHVLARGDDPEATRVALGFVDSHGLLVSANVPGAAVGPEGLARLAARMKAAAELALILAEVEP